ncbi:MAG: hypothetical protein FWG38_06235 [Defluviitaleaceae bacterium]|nr:hypothetical protein [Defluviitaleaceae bacterium]
MLRWMIGGAVGGVLLFALFVLFVLPGGRSIAPVQWASDFDYYYVKDVSDQPLFRADGTVNFEVLSALLDILDTPTLCAQARPVTAADFSRHVVPYPASMSHSGAIVLQLFEPVPGRLAGFTNAQWQLVYRTADDTQDVLTLWMTAPYRVSPFGGSRFDALAGLEAERYLSSDGPLHWAQLTVNENNTVPCDTCVEAGNTACNTFFFEGNYGASIARYNLLRDMGAVLDFFDVSQFFVSPRYIPGRWQSARAQTGTNVHMRYFGYGAAGLIWGAHTHFHIGNGKDGANVGPVDGVWPHTAAIATYNDLIWLPSDFEVRSMGHSNEVAQFQTFIAYPDTPQSHLRWNYVTREDDGRYDVTNGRSGLWELNGFDRAFYVPDDNGMLSRLVWLRSADSLGIGNANTVYHTGNRYGLGVVQAAGLRPAVHISITELRRLLDA